MNVSRLVEYEGDFGSRDSGSYQRHMHSPWGRGMFSLKQLANLVSNMICDVGVVRVNVRRPGRTVTILDRE